MPEERNKDDAGNPEMQVIGNGGTKAIVIDVEPGDDSSPTSNGSPAAPEAEGQRYSSQEERGDGGGSSCGFHVVDLTSNMVVPDDTTTEDQPRPDAGTINGDDCPWPIRRVHGRVRDIDPGAYDPMVVSLGPYHADRKDLRPMQKEKWRCVEYLCDLTGTPSYVDYLPVMDRVCPDAKTYYLDETGHGRSRGGNGAGGLALAVEHANFLHMLLRDAAFLLVSIGALDKLKKADEGGAEQRSQDRWKDVAIAHDMLLLENQVPFVVVEDLYRAAIDTAGRRGCDVPSLSTVMGKFIRGVIQEAEEQDLPLPHHLDGKTPHHLLHLCHTLLEPTPKEPASPVPDNVAARVKRRWHRAAQYHVNGVGLKKRLFSGGVDHSHHSLLDVKFKGGALEIPVLHVYDNTCSLLRNLIAMEQASSDSGVGHYVTAYCIFLSRLMCTAEDVTLLAKKGIVVHHLGSDEVVAGLFADLCKNVVFNEDDDECNYHRAACKAADERYQKRVWNWMTLLKHKHFSNPWLAMATVAAVLVTICTVVQTFFTVFPRK
uniref:Uncharacterized protein n=1 Tax=Oryza rufipogon TaxID=4529 RepID=A0A0E0QPE7_ORYRU